MDLTGMMLSDKKPTSKCSILYGSIYITFWKYHVENRVVGDRFQGLGRNRGWGWPSRDRTRESVWMEQFCILTELVIT